MSDAPALPRARPMRAALLGGGLLLAAFGGAAAMRWWGVGVAPQPSSASSAAARSTRPIVQIVRQQAGLPDLSDLVDRTCPAVALLVPAGAILPVGDGPAAPAIRVTNDGWLLGAAAALPDQPLEAVFGTGERVAVTTVRTDPVSGLSIFKVAASPGDPVAFSDGAAPRAGQSGLAVATPAGLGCSAASAMVQSDFVTDGGAQNGYFRLAPIAADWPAGLAILGTDGRIVGVVAGSPQSGTALPATISSLIVDELLRNALSPTAAFGFRAIDYEGSLASRLGDVRSGAGIALVETGSKAAKAGLRAGDIVTTVDGTPVSGASELGRALDGADDSAQLIVQRRDRQLTLTVGRTVAKA